MKSKLISCCFYYEHAVIELLRLSNYLLCFNSVYQGPKFFSTSIKLVLTRRRRVGPGPIKDGTEILSFHIMVRGADTILCASISQYHNITIDKTKFTLKINFFPLID